MQRRLLLLPCLLPLFACTDRTTEPSGEAWFETAEAFRDWNWSHFVGDFDGDGLDDIVLTGGAEGVAAIVYGRADAQIPEEPDLVVRASDHAPESPIGLVALGDINGDGFDDIARFGPQEHGSSVFLGRPRADGGSLADLGEPAFTIEDSELWPSGDLDADGIDDFVVRFWTSDSRTVGVIRGRANWSDFGEGSLPGDSILILDPVDSPRRVGDVNGDGHDDLALSPIGGALSLHSGATLPWGETLSGTLPAPDLGGLDAPADQTPFFSIPGGIVPGVSVYPLGDLDGDGRDDFAAGHLHHDERPVTFVVYGAAEPFVRARAELSEGRGGYRIDGEASSLLAADVNEDGAADLVFGAVGDTDGHSWVFDRTNMPTLSVRAVLQRPAARTTPASGVALPRPPQARLYGRFLSRGDFNGDGAVDLVASFDVAVSDAEARTEGALLLGR